MKRRKMGAQSQPASLNDSCESMNHAPTPRLAQEAMTITCPRDPDNIPRSLGTHQGVRFTDTDLGHPDTWSLVQFAYLRAGATKQNEVRTCHYQHCGSDNVRLSSADNIALSSKGLVPTRWAVLMGCSMPIGAEYGFAAMQLNTHDIVARAPNLG
jgi:hypothetical protein